MCEFQNPWDEDERKKYLDLNADSSVLNLNNLLITTFAMHSSTQITQSIRIITANNTSMNQLSVKCLFSSLPPSTHDEKECRPRTDFF
jgi:hypothetical protein